MGISSSRRPKKPSFKDEEIDVAELAGMSNMKGMLSFLDTKPEDYARMLLPRPTVTSSLLQAPEPECVSRSLPDSSLPSASNQLPDSTLSSGHPEQNGLPTPHRPGLKHISSLVSGSNLLPGLALPSAPERRQQADNNQLPGSSQLPDSRMLSGSHLHAQNGDPSGITPTPQPHSNLLPGGDLRTPNGRTVRLRPARSVQDAHTNGEHLLLTAMWKKGSPESDDTRLLRAGLAELSRWTGSHKTSCRAYIRALIAKLALEEAETFDAAAGSEGARVYRIFSFNRILERRRRANLTHVIRTGAVWFVDPKTGEKLLQIGRAHV